MKNIKYKKKIKYYQLEIIIFLYTFNELFKIKKKCFYLFGD